MELKQQNEMCKTAVRRLLIVPYGIETWILASSATSQRLLIVPYGIETSLRTHARIFASLLIVPYGIETKYARRKPRAPGSFNRTLWN